MTSPKEGAQDLPKSDLEPVEKRSVLKARVIGEIGSHEPHQAPRTTDSFFFGAT